MCNDGGVLDPVLVHVLYAERLRACSRRPPCRKRRRNGSTSWSATTCTSRRAGRSKQRNALCAWHGAGASLRPGTPATIFRDLKRECCSSYLRKAQLQLLATSVRRTCWVTKDSSPTWNSMHADHCGTRELIRDKHHKCPAAGLRVANRASVHNTTPPWHNAFAHNYPSKHQRPRKKHW